MCKVPVTSTCEMVVQFGKGTVVGRGVREDGVLHEEVPKKDDRQARFSFDELLTAVTEVEAIFNSRPLSYVTSDDIDEPLTPSHLLIGQRVLSLPDDLSYQGEISFRLNSK